MKTPILETSRLLLRPLSVADAETIFTNWTSDPDVARFMIWELHKSISDTEQWLAYEEASIESDTVYTWGFQLKETGELIGSGGLIFREEKGIFELGYNIMKKYWNQGITTEAAQRIIDFGKTELQQKRFYCCHAKDNPASGRVMTKVGFRYYKEGIYYSRSRERKFESKEYQYIVQDESTECRPEAQVSRT